MGIDAEMFLKFRRPIEASEVLDQAKRLWHRFGESCLFLSSQDYGEGEDRRHCAYIVPVIHQDGPDIDPEPGETFVRLSLWERFYGPGYERGRWFILDALIRYLNRVWPEAEVWYGGDSSGVLHQHADAAFLEEMMAHYVQSGHHPYRPTGDSLAQPVSFGGLRLEGQKCEIPVPDPCQRCMEPLVRSGWGKDFASWYCSTCNFATETRDGGKTWAAPKRGAV